MKNYEILAHLPGQVERFLNCLTQGPEAQVQTENSIEIIKALLQDKNFDNGLSDYKRQLENKVDNIEKQAINKIKTNPDIKSIEDVMKILNKAIANVDEVNEDYVRTLQSYILGFISKLGDNDGSSEEL